MPKTCIDQEKKYEKYYQSEHPLIVTTHSPMETPLPV